MKLKTETIAFRISTDEKKLLEAKATRQDIPVSQLIREAIKLYLNKEDLK